MVWTELTIKAAKLAYENHKDMTDKLGMPYIFHLTSVASQMSTPVETAVALLHDLAEDAPGWKSLTKAGLAEHMEEEGFPPQVAEAMWLLKHQANTPYQDYVLAIARSGNPVAQRVKLMDLLDNFNKLHLISDPDLRARLSNKYSNALAVFRANVT